MERKLKVISTTALVVPFMCMRNAGRGTRLKDIKLSLVVIIGEKSEA